MIEISDQTEFGVSGGDDQLRKKEMGKRGLQLKKLYNNKNITRFPVHRQRRRTAHLRRRERIVHLLRHPDLCLRRPM